MADVPFDGGDEAAPRCEDRVSREETCERKKRDFFFLVDSAESL